MNLKSIVLLLALLKSVFCQDCTFSYDPIDNCDLSIYCVATSDIANIAESRQPYPYCSPWKRRATFSNIHQSVGYCTSITCSSCENENVFGSFYEFEIIDSACTLIPAFNDFPNVKVIRINNAGIEDISMTSHNLMRLRVLDLSRNKILNIFHLELFSSNGLEILNVSCNSVNTINDQVFRHIPSLKTLDLTNNLLENISSLTFYGLPNLKTLHLSNNKITEINLAFDSLVALEAIYLDNNNLHAIKENDFKGLNNLMTLKLSYNFIVEFDWKAMKNIPVLEMFDVSHNGIKEVSNTAFENNTYLSHVDLSYNNITRLVPNTFRKNNVTFFSIQSNNLEGGLEIGMFEGIKVVGELDLSHQSIEAVADFSFYGLTYLSVLLLNDNKLKTISKKAFLSLLELETLDLSNNKLLNIDFDMNELKKIKNLLLNNNLIARIGPQDFSGLQFLEHLNLAHNNLANFNEKTFSTILPELTYLNISHNNLDNIQSDAIDKMTNLVVLDLSYNKNLTITYNLNSYLRTLKEPKLESVSISDCNMTNVNCLKLPFYENIFTLVFIRNQVRKIEYGMFSNNTMLKYLDLSFNKISYIQPGSFKDNNELKELYIAHNELLDIEYGSLRGLNQLSLLDISYNKIKSLKNGRFYDTSSLNTLIADSNNIESIEHQDFIGVNLKTLSIGGNPIPCSVLINLETETHSVQVTALAEELHLANFKGVSCNRRKNDTSIINAVDNNVYLERGGVLLEDIRNILLEIKNTNYSEQSESGRTSNILFKITNLTESINRSFYKTDDRLINMIEKLNNNSKIETNNTIIQMLAKTDVILDYIKNHMISSGGQNNVSGDVFDQKNATEIRKYDALLRDKSFERDIERELAQSTQTKLSTLADFCLIFITLVMICFMVYKIYALSSLRKRHTASTEHINIASLSRE